MMLTPLPFSGLSLLVHLGVIALATLAGLLGLSRRKRVKKPMLKHTAVRVTLNAIASILIIGFIGGITLLFIYTALVTGFQSGADEPQRVFIEQIIS